MYTDSEVLQRQLKQLEDKTQELTDWETEYELFAQCYVTNQSKPVLGWGGVISSGTWEQLSDTN